MAFLDDERRGTVLEQIQKVIMSRTREVVVIQSKPWIEIRPPGIQQTGRHHQTLSCKETADTADVRHSLQSNRDAGTLRS
jgi:hypothetical protein